MDTLLSLKVLTTVADLRSFSAAAERLQLSPAMVSRHVQALETRVGSRLLQRTSRRVAVTEAGAAYIERIRPLLEGIEDAEAQLSQTTLRPSGVLRVSMPVWAASPGFARLFATFRTRHPEILLDLDLSGRLVNLVEDGFDLALRVTAAPPEGLIGRKLTEVTFPFVAAPALLDRIGRPDRPEDLTDAPLLAYTPVAASGRLRLGASLDLRMTPVVRSANETLLHLLAREGLGIGLLPDLLVAEDLADGRLERVLPDLPPPGLALQAFYPQRSYLPAKVRCLLDFLTGPDGVATLHRRPRA
ncbi:LysR family transcriptional regulator [Pseudanabaena biceps]|nr:LysR family transcriptional regulator [Pseudanabaena biceps]